MESADPRLILLKDSKSLQIFRLGGSRSDHNKRLLLAKAFCVFACFHAPFVFFLDLIQAFDVLVKELGLTRYALRAAIKAPEQRYLVRGWLIAFNAAAI